MRCALGTGVQTCALPIYIVAGILVAYLTNYLLAGAGGEDAWRYMLGIMAVPAVVFYGLLWLIPESPRWLASKGRATEAADVFLRLGEQIGRASCRERVCHYL